jgi:hypothetical protein
MRFLRGAFVASVALVGALLLTACGGQGSTSGSADGEKPQVDRVVSDDEVPGNRPDVDNPDEGEPALGAKVFIDAAVTFEIADGTVSWTAGRMIEGDFGPEVESTNDGTPDSAPLHEYAEFAAPSGCEEPFGDVHIDGDGVGLTSCSLESYSALETHYAPKIWLDEDGRVVKVADRYHP